MAKINPIDIEGLKVNFVTVNAYIGVDGKYHAYSCTCVCGKKIITLRHDLVGIGNKRLSCGCKSPRPRGEQHKSFKHGKTKSRAYNTWVGMRSRCVFPGNPKYDLYGGRGIRFCSRWKTFSNFLSDMGEPKPGETLDRIDVDGDYIPSNCRWASQKTQQNNRRNNRFLTVNGITKSILEWAQDSKISVKVLRQRIDRDKLSPHEAIHKPLRKLATRNPTEMPPIIPKEVKPCD